MNPSLREEIFLASNRFTTSYHKTHELTNEIMSIFEKRIDSIKQYPATNGYQKAWNKGENRIKKEMKEMLK